MATKKPKPDNPVTPQAADTFELEVRKWQDRLNLNDWRIERSPKPAGKKNLAEIASMSLKDRLAEYRLGIDFGENKPVTGASVEEVACHEVLHVRLHELIEFAKDPKSAPEDIDAAEHAVINVFVKLLIGD